MRAKFKIFQSENDQQWYWSLYANNNKIILSSEGYTSKWMAIKGTISVRWNSLFDLRFQHLRTDDRSAYSRSHYFILVAGNGKTIGKSQTYLTRYGSQNGILSVKKHAKFAALKVENGKVD